MKQDIFEVLWHLFENYMGTDCKLQWINEDILVSELEKAGFHSTAVDRALEWLEGLIEVQENTTILSNTTSLRAYTPYETFKLNAEILGFLLFLQQMGILNTITRELVIDRLMAIDEQEIDLNQVKWVTFLVLFNQPNEEVALACMEILVLEHTAYGLH